MGSKFFINYLRQKWCQINDLYVAVALYWVCRYRLPSAVVDYHISTNHNPNPMPKPDTNTDPIINRNPNPNNPNHSHTLKTEIAWRWSNYVPGEGKYHVLYSSAIFYSAWCILVLRLTVNCWCSPRSTFHIVKTLFYIRYCGTNVMIPVLTVTLIQK